MLIDLQLHSTYSDGYLTPAQVAKFIAGQKVKIAALTDHNTVAGLAEFAVACKKYGVRPLNGLELYVRFESLKFNVLWYNFDDNNARLHELLRNSQVRRRNRVRRVLEKLKTRGLKIEADKILDKFNHYVPINRVTDDILATPGNLAIVKKRLKNKNPREMDIIKEYFKNEKVAVLRESYIDIKRILALQKTVGGQLILNHPAKHSYIRKETWVKVKRLGLDGVEVLSPHHSVGAIMYAQHLARELDFITTGGSDFHRFEGHGQPVQSAFDYFEIDSRYLRKIKKIIG